MSQLSTFGGLAHPEWVAGRRLWVDPVMQDIIDKIQQGDSSRGWEGDPRLCVFSGPHPDGMIWYLDRLEDDGEYRPVARSKPGVVFDERIIDRLVQNDGRRNPKRDLFDEIMRQNDARDEEVERVHNEYLVEEAAPRLHHAFMKDGLI